MYLLKENYQKFEKQIGRHNFYL